MYEKYSEGLSLSEVGNLYGITRQSVYDGFKRRSYQLRKRNEQSFQTYDGIKFTKRNHGYYAATTGERQLMHRYIWEKYNGPIPKGYDIHHIDHNRENNDITNLAIFTKSEHASLFNTGSNQYVKRPFKESV
jgi:predicted DNA-binding protein YlxM (UPF0122 family)